MLDKKHIVPVPDGAIVKSDRVVLWTIQKVYMKDKQYNNDKRRMIGKTLEADREKMYPNDTYKELFPERYDELVKPIKVAPSRVSLGCYVALKTIAERIPLYMTLVEVFGKQDADLIMDYAMYQIIYESDVSTHFEFSMNGKAIFSEKLRSDSYLSDFFQTKFSEEQTDLFKELWSTRIIKARKLTGAYLNVDGSNSDCEAKGVSLRELGHDKSGQGTTIVNVMYAVAPDGTPITYHQYRGSVVDEKAVKFMILYFDALKISIRGFCIDRGFCNKANTDMLRNNGIDFVMMVEAIPVGFTESIQELRNSLRNNIEKWIEGSELFGYTVQKKLFAKDEEDSYLHVYYECERAGSSIKELLKRINRTKTKALKAIKAKKEVSIPDDLKLYIDLRKGRGPKTLEMYPDKIQEAIDSKGCHVLASAKAMTALEAYNIYHTRDSAEKQFMFMKSRLGMDTYRGGSDATIGGKQFVAFIAGILRNELNLASNQMLAIEDRTDRYSVPAIVNELCSISMKRLPGDEYALIMDLSARDKFMLKHLGITEKQLDEYVKIQALRIKGKNR